MVCPVTRSLIRQKSLSAVKILCPAKLNLYLNITGMYSNGFHRIESIFTRISLCDELTIRRTGDPSITFSCDDHTLENEDNLCVRAARLITRRYRIGGGFSLHLKKNVPVGAGLGGGSSDAASTLLGIQSLCGIDLSREDLYSMGALLGSDVNFFLAQTPFALVRGRGEKVTPLDITARPCYYILYPGERLSTARVYKATKVKLTKFLNNVNIISYALNCHDYDLLGDNIFNVLERGAFRASGRLRGYKGFLQKNGFTMSGSGSAFFKIVREKRDHKYLEVRVPGKWRGFRAQSI